MALDPRFIERQRQDLFHLTNLARNDLRLFLWQVKDLPVAEVRDLLIQVMPEVVEPVMQASGDLAATWYEDLRREVGARGSFYASSPAASVERARMDAVARWAVDPLVPTAASAGDPDAVLRRLAGATQRMIFDAARGVVEGNAMRDPVKVGYQRMARPGCCAFCGMLASRGAVYSSASSGGRVVGRGKDVAQNFNADGSQRVFGNRMAGGVKARGTREMKSDYHDDCQCVVMPVFVGTELEQIAQADQSKFEELYIKASKAGGGDTKSLLAAWREQNGSA